MASNSCSSDVVLTFSVDSLQVVPGLLATAVVLGIVTGGVAAGLLCWYVLLPLLSRKVKEKVVTSVEDKKSDIKQGNQEAPTKAKKKMKIRESKLLPLEEEGDRLSDNGVAAFALKAKVVYPINQKFRPLADGASNPSLHENYKRTRLPNQIFEDSAESSMESMSQGEKEDGSSSTTIHSNTSLDRFYERMFPRVSSFPEVLQCNGCDVKLCLYSLCLQSLPLLNTELREEQYVMFVQILRINLSDLLLQKKIDRELYAHVISSQEAELEELEQKYQSRLMSNKSYHGKGLESQTMEDIERREREYSDHLIRNLEGFWKQIENVHQLLHDKAKCSYEEAERIMMNLILKMIAVEGILSDSQEELAMEIQEKMIRWEHMAKIVESLKYQIQEESECRLNAVSKTLEQLTIKKKLTVKQKEQHLTQLFKDFWEEVSRYNKDSYQQTKAAIAEHLGHRNKLIDILQKKQIEERANFLARNKGSVDADHFIMEYHKLLEDQRELQGALEDEEDCKVIDAVAELGKDLYTGASQTFEKLVKKLFLQTLPENTNLTLGECESMKHELRQNLSIELEKAENERKTKIRLFQEMLVQEKQLWIKEQVQSSDLDKYVCETQQQVIQGVLIRLSGLSEDSNKFALQRHKFLLRSILRTLALRNIAIATLTQMRMWRKIVIVQELREQHALERCKWHLQDEEQWQTQKEMNAHILEEENKLEEETWQAHSDFQQQLLLDLTDANNGIRHHMERTIGQMLIHRAQQEAAKTMMEDNGEFKERLVEAAVESVYVTSNNVNKLVQGYNENIEKILKDHEKEKSKHLKAIKESASKLGSNHKLAKTNPMKKLPEPSSSYDLHEKLISQQKQLLEKLRHFQQIRLETLKQKKSVLHLLEGQLENKLKDTEQEFIAELASMARMRLADNSSSVNRNMNSEPSSRIPSMKKLK
ncbi:ellis-van Creveld syndrome protein [Bufo bufo]|uniref:ellis-van Creveld syndrome protein n=1 Tax=Bufo bufo TaxID=8384 RepID=UPI001ABE136D|nr:ellis-van Creveld syndrome protein [Bufo bufo]